MNTSECIQAAREAHTSLRLRSGGITPDERSTAAYRMLKAAFDELWPQCESNQLHRAIGRLVSVRRSTTSGPGCRCQNMGVYDIYQTRVGSS